MTESTRLQNVGDLIPRKQIGSAAGVRHIRVAADMNRTVALKTVSHPDPPRSHPGRSDQFIEEIQIHGAITHSKQIVELCTRAGCVDGIQLLFMEYIDEPHCRFSTRKIHVDNCSCNRGQYFRIVI